MHTCTWEEHLETLGELLHRLQIYNLTVRPTKCVFGSAEVDFVGHKLSLGIIGLQEDNINKIRDAPRPTTKKQVRSFLGLTGYYRDFVPNYATLAYPLTSLTKKGQPNRVKWGKDQDEAYDALKRAITTRPILHIPNMHRSFILRTDASDVGLGAALLQEDNKGILHPVAFASKKLMDRETRYSTIEKECLAIVWAIRKFELYLYGRTFTLQTDHQPLRYINTARFVSARIMRWAMFLQSYNFTVQSITGENNVEADFLSRLCC